MLVNYQTWYGEYPYCGTGILLSYLHTYCEEYTPSTLDTYPFPNPYPHVNTVTMSELIITSSAYIINGDSPMTSVANTVAMTTLAVHTLQPLIFYTAACTLRVTVGSSYI